MKKSYRWILMILFAVIITTLYRVLTRDKNISSKAPLKQYSLFDSTLKVSLPFAVTENVIDNPNPKMLEKALYANYSSKNASFISLCYKLNPSVSVSSMDEGLKLMLKSFDSSTGTKFSIDHEDSIVINNTHFKRFFGTRKFENSNPLDKKDNFNFEALTTINSKYAYLIYFDENIDNSDSENLKDKIFSSIMVQ